MGYDMYWEQEPEEMREFFRRSNEMMRRGEQVTDELGELYLKVHASDAYFRLGVYTMADFRDYMAELGMLVWMDHEVFQSPADAGVIVSAGTKDEDWVEGYWPIREWLDGIGPMPVDADPSTVELVRRFKANVDRIKDAEPIQPPVGIPSYKLCSNDQWLVTPNEIRAALAAYELNGPADDERFEDEYEREEWDEWLHFMKVSAEHGGFRVH